MPGAGVPGDEDEFVGAEEDHAFVLRVVRNKVLKIPDDSVPVPGLEAGGIRFVYRALECGLKILDVGLRVAIDHDARGVEVPDLRQGGLRGGRPDRLDEDPAVDEPVPGAGQKFGVQVGAPGHHVAEVLAVFVMAFDHEGHDRLGEGIDDAGDLALLGGPLGPGIPAFRGYEMRVIDAALRCDVFVIVGGVGAEVHHHGRRGRSGKGAGERSDEFHACRVGRGPKKGKSARGCRPGRRSSPGWASRRT